MQRQLNLLFTVSVISTLIVCTAAQRRQGESEHTSLRRQLLKTNIPKGCPRIVIPWGNPDVLALYKRPSKNAVIRPYAKYFTSQSGAYFYKTITGAKKDCPILFDWAIPPNAVSRLYNVRGVVYSRKGVCLTKPSQYTITKGYNGEKDSRYTQRYVTPRHRGGFYFWDSSNHLKDPAAAGSPYAQFWLSCQFGVYVKVVVS